MGELVTKLKVEETLKKDKNAHGVASLVELLFIHIDLFDVFLLANNNIYKLKV
jgi:hypothetical protein